MALEASRKCLDNLKAKYIEDVNKVSKNLTVLSG